MKKIILSALLLLTACGPKQELVTEFSADPVSVNHETASASPTATPSPSPTPSPPQEETVAGRFVTSIYDRSGGRTNNLNVATESLNGTVIQPGEEFSFNGTVGKRSSAKGYKKAIIFVDGEKVKEYGGGVCQISSTIYNAALAAGLKILERHDHQLKVDYVPRGKEAAVAYGSKDLRFVNTKPHPLRLSVEIGNNYVSATLINTH